MKARLLLSAWLCLMTVPVAADDAFVARPLFSPDRRPVPDRPTSAPQAGRELPAGTWRLTGIISGRGGQTVILLSGSEGAPVLRARPGDSVNGWLILDAGDHSIRLSRRGETHRSALRQAIPE